MAMLPFIGYHAGDYMNHWLEIGKSADASKLPRIFGVNWFRRDEEDGSFLWPGFGENSRVLKWVVERLEGDADAVETPIGFVPTADSLDIDGLDMTPEQVAKAVKVDHGRVGEGAAPHPGVVRQVRRPAPRGAVGRVRRSQGPRQRSLRSGPPPAGRRAVDDVMQGPAPHGAGPSVIPRCPSKPA